MADKKQAIQDSVKSDRLRSESKRSKPKRPRRSKRVGPRHTSSRSVTTHSSTNSQSLASETQQSTITSVTTLDSVYLHRKPRSGTPLAYRRSGKPVGLPAQRCIDKFVDGVNSLGVAGLKKEYVEVRREDASAGMPIDGFCSNQTRNRFKDIICIDKTRVVLTLDVPPETDYIHASWVKMRDLDRIYIATQAPLPSTVPDFWRMCFQESVLVIVVLCQAKEDERVQFPEYWPRREGDAKIYGNISVSNIKVVDKEHTITYTLRMSSQLSSLEKSSEPEDAEKPNPSANASSVKSSTKTAPAPKVLELLHLTEWPERGVPECGLLRLFRRLPKQGPCVVHCSGGIGRTSILIAVDTIIQRLLKGISVTTKEVVRELREKRALSVQTTPQYVFIAWVVLCYMKAKNPLKYQKPLARLRSDIQFAGFVKGEPAAGSAAANVVSS